MTRMATDDQPKRPYRRREVLARKCSVCGSRNTGVYAGDRNGDGELRSDVRYCKCYDCDATWKQRPAG